MRNMLIALIAAVLAILGASFLYFSAANKTSAQNPISTSSYTSTSVATTAYTTIKSNFSTTTVTQSSQQYGTVAYAGDGTLTNAGSLPACPSGTSYLTRSPLNGSQLSWIEPLGHMGGTAHILPSQGDHIYFYAQALSNGTPALTPVYSPGNVTLLQVAAAKSNVPREPSTSYILFFSPCKSVMFGFQLASISSLVQNAILGLTPYTCSNSSQQSLCVYANLAIQLKAGDRLGSIGVYSFDWGLDFAAADVRTPVLAFIDKTTSTGFLGDSYAHAVCPLDYFANATKTYLYGRQVIRNVSANGIPACGTTMQDLAGTLQGNWYSKTSAQQPYRGLNISASLAIAHLDTDPHFGIISAGGALFRNPAGGAQLIFSPQSSGQINREPSQVTPDGKVYCYQGPVSAGPLYTNGTINPNAGPQGHMDIRLDNATALEIDYSPGQCAATPVLTNPAVYVR